MNTKSPYISAAIMALAAVILTLPANAMLTQSGSKRAPSRRIYQPNPSQNSSLQNQQRRTPSSTAARIGFDGYCPVCILAMNKWVKGSPEFQSSFDNAAYYFPDAATKQKFDASPEQFVPALGGDCTVCLAKMGKRVPGTIKFASLHKNRVFLFPEAKQKEMFDASPDEFANIDLAAEGNCVVCSTKMNKAVPGSDQFTAIHQGMRYLFPSDAERQIFLKSPTQFANISSDSPTLTARLGYDGYCPVCIVAIKKWVMGNPQHTATYDNIRYQFPDAGTKQKFIANPTAYVPALSGDCTVCLAKMGKRVPGKIEFASLHNNRVFLFPEAKQKATFDASPAEFANVDLAANGNCVVCSAKMNKQVAGSTEFTAIHNGLRYLFPSDAERQIFLNSPTTFVGRQANAAGEQSGFNKTSFNTKAKAQSNYVSIQGKTGCAGCTYGVTPLGSPDELGLAVVDSTGKVYVIEESHTRWPALYKARFDGKQVQVTGNIIKSQGNIVWIQPNNLSVL